MEEYTFLLVFFEGSPPIFGKFSGHVGTPRHLEASRFAPSIGTKDWEDSGSCNLGRGLLCL